MLKAEKREDGTARCQVDGLKNDILFELKGLIAGIFEGIAAKEGEEMAQILIHMAVDESIDTELSKRRLDTLDGPSIKELLELEQIN